MTDAQNCGNILAGVGPFAIERGLVAARDGETPVTIYMENTGQIAEALIKTPDGAVAYARRCAHRRRAGQPPPRCSSPSRTPPARAAARFCPPGRPVDVIDGIEATLIDNGMPVVVMRAADLGVTGSETREELEANAELKARLESIRLKAGPMMNLGDVRQEVRAEDEHGERAFRRRARSRPAPSFPHRCHASIGVLGAVSVATACMLEGSPAAALARIPEGRNLRSSSPEGGGAHNQSAQHRAPNRRDDRARRTR